MRNMYMICASCGTVALNGPYSFLIFEDHRATDFSILKTCDSALSTCCAALRGIFVMKSFVRAIKYTYFASLDIYLQPSLLIYLLLFMFSSLS